jgi:hypothetical protein
VLVTGATVVEAPVATRDSVEAEEERVVGTTVVDPPYVKTPSMLDSWKIVRTYGSDAGAIRACEACTTAV